MGMEESDEKGHIFKEAQGSKRILKTIAQRVGLKV